MRRIMTLTLCLVAAGCLAACSGGGGKVAVDGGDTAVAEATGDSVVGDAAGDGPGDAAADPGGDAGGDAVVGPDGKDSGPLPDLGPDLGPDTGPLPEVSQDAAPDVGPDGLVEVKPKPCLSSDDCDDGDPCTADLCDAETWTCLNIVSPDLCGGCEADGGICVPPSPEPETPPCPDGMASVGPVGCAGGDICCMPFNPCLESGGLCIIPLPDQDGDGCPDGMGAVYLAGCGPMEICCVPVPATECEQKGGVCAPWDPQYSQCPPGTGPSGYMCKTKSEVCCVGVTECAQEGQSVPGVPGGMECCPGLDKIVPAEYDPATGECEMLIGGVICAACGNGTCEADWENMCSCPVDCPLPPMECYGPMVPCPEGFYCQYAAGTCDLVGGTGECMLVPDVCPEMYAPVCGCDGNTYDNECFMEAAQVSKDHDGACKCLGLGGEFTDFNTEGKCCEGLVPASACILDPGSQGCACPNCPCYICLKCGDGVCGAFEHQCNCPKDCK